MATMKMFATRSALVVALLLAVTVGAVRGDTPHKHLTLVDVQTPPPEWLLPVLHMSRGVDVLTDEESVRPVFQWRYDGKTDPLTASNPKKVQMNLNDIFYVPDALEVGEEAECTFSQQTETYKSMGEFASSIAASAGVSFELASLGAFSASGSFHRSLKQTSAGERFMVRAEASCAVASVVMQYDKALLHPAFAAMLNSLPAKAEGNRLGQLKDGEVAMYEDFIETYGTHFVSRTQLGGIITRERSVTMEELSRASSSGGGLGALVELTASTERETSTSSESSQTTVHARGGAPGSFGEGGENFATEWGQWAATLPRNPILMNRELRPMYDLVEDPARKAMLKHAVRRYVKRNAHMFATEFVLVMLLDEETELEELTTTMTVEGNVGTVDNIKFRWVRPATQLVASVRALNVGMVKKIVLRTQLAPRTVFLLNSGTGTGHRLERVSSQETVAVGPDGPEKLLKLTFEPKESQIEAAQTKWKKFIASSAASTSSLKSVGDAVKVFKKRSNMKDGDHALTETVGLSAMLARTRECGVYTIVLAVRDHKLVDESFRLRLHIQGSAGVITGSVPLTRFNSARAFLEVVKNKCPNGVLGFSKKKSGEHDGEEEEEEGEALLHEGQSTRVAVVALLSGSNLGTVQSLKVDLFRPADAEEPQDVHDADATTQMRIAQEMCMLMLEPRNGIRECNKHALDKLTEKMQPKLKNWLRRKDGSDIDVTEEQCEAVFRGVSKSNQAGFTCKPSFFQYGGSVFGMMRREWKLHATSLQAKRVLRLLRESSMLGRMVKPSCVNNDKARKLPVMFRSPCSKFFPVANPEPIFSYNLDWDKEPRVDISQAYIMAHADNSVRVGQFNADVTKTTSVTRTMV